MHTPWIVEMASLRPYHVDVESPSEHKPIAQLAHGLDRVLFKSVKFHSSMTSAPFTPYWCHLLPRDLAPVQAYIGCEIRVPAFTTLRHG